VQFTDALVCSDVVVFRKSPPRPEHRARFSFGGPIERPQQEAFLLLDMLRHSRKWTQFPGRTAVENNGELTLGDIFAIKRGLATGSNSFFILTPEHVHEWGISKEFLKPILPGPRYVMADIIEAHPNGDPAVSPRLYLLDCCEPEEKISASRNISREATRKRSPNPISPAIARPGTRKNNVLHRHSLELTWDAHATASIPSGLSGTARRRLHTTSTSCSIPKAPLLGALKNHPELEKRVFQALQRITPSQLVSEGRVYGGGLQKVEPRELPQIRAREVLDCIDSHVQIERQEKLFPSR
jgi:adenine-specific DNA-methyltransferase